jgi:Predicted phosphohydrolases
MRDGYTAEISSELHAVVERLDKEHEISHTFVLGDLIEDGKSVEGDRENIKRTSSIFEEWSVPVTYLLGNHDVEHLSKPQLRSLLGQDEFYGVQDVEGTSFVYLDSAYQKVRGATGKIGPEQLEWLEQIVPTLSDAVLLVHHPVGNFDLRANEWFSEYPERAYLWDRKEVLKRIEGTAVRATISGHIHQVGYDNFRGLPHVSANAFSKELPDVPLTGTYAVLETGDIPHLRVRTRTNPGVRHSIPSV